MYRSIIIILAVISSSASAQTMSKMQMQECSEELAKKFEFEKYKIKAYAGIKNPKFDSRKNEMSCLEGALHTVPSSVGMAWQFLRDSVGAGVVYAFQHPQEVKKNVSRTLSETGRTVSNGVRYGASLNVSEAFNLAGNAARHGATNLQQMPTAIGEVTKYVIQNLYEFYGCKGFSGNTAKDLFENMECKNPPPKVPNCDAMAQVVCSAAGELPLVMLSLTKAAYMSRTLAQSSKMAFPTRAALYAADFAHIPNAGEMAIYRDLLKRAKYPQNKYSEEPVRQEESTPAQHSSQ